MILAGEAGIGKTALWEWGLHAGRERGYRVLAAQASRSEAKLSYSGIDDLLEPVLEESLPAIREPRRRALEIALLRRRPRGHSPDRWAVAKSVLDVLRLIADRGPLVVGIDDVQWLDRPSASVLAFGLRRLRDERVGVLLSVRSGGEEETPLEVDRAFPRDRVRKVVVGPMDRNEVQRIVRSTVGMGLPQPLLERVHETSGGNPFFALELAREVVRRGMDALVTEDGLGIPHTVRDAVAARLAPLTSHTRGLLIHAAALNLATIQLLRMIGGRRTDRAIEEATDAGIIELDDDRVRFTHPLLASVLFDDADAASRRKIHHRLARFVADPEERARHMALAATGPDGGTARALEDAARHAAARGAPEAAGALFEQAARLSPDSQRHDAFRRSVDAIDHFFHSGEMARATELAEGIGHLDLADWDRAVVVFRLGGIQAREARWAEAERSFRTALALAVDRPALRAEVEQELAIVAIAGGRLEECVAHGRRAFELARSTGEGSVIAEAAGALLGFEFIAGHGIREDLLPYLEGDNSETVAEFRPNILFQDYRMALGIVLKWADDFEACRRILGSRYERARQTGDEAALPYLLYQLSELECWAGRWDDAERYTREGLAVLRDGEVEWAESAALYTSALLHACRGNVASARNMAERAIESAVRTNNLPMTVLTHSTIGFLEVSLGEFAAAYEHLALVEQAMLGMGATEPGVVRFLADEIEALVGMGQLDEARKLTDHLERRGRELDRPWALATGARSRALVLAAEGDLDGAAAAVDEALGHHPRLPMPLEEGRTWLVSGTIARRAKRKADARESLTRALQVFEGLGAGLWAKKTHSELARIGQRPPTSLELTPTEARVAELVASGQTNREVAAALFISEKTVEANLSRIYRKVGVRSRTELARRLHRVETPR